MGKPNKCHCRHDELQVIFLPQTHSLRTLFFSFRIGVLGFLYEEESGIVGNYGTQDQIVALKFVQENIGAFGGDPSQVTIFGQSAGASSVSVLMMDPVNSNLFHAAIMESNPFGIPLRTPQSWRAIVNKFLSLVKCSRGSVRQCLEGVPLEEIIRAQNQSAHDVFAELPGLLNLAIAWCGLSFSRFL